MGVKPDAIGFRMVLNDIHRLFGCKKTFRKSLFDNLMKQPEVNINSYEQVKSFKTKLQVYVDNQYQEGKKDELKDNGGALYHMIGTKFSPNARENLATYCSARRIGCNTLAILEWLKDRIDSHAESIYIEQQPRKSMKAAEKVSRSFHIKDYTCGQNEDTFGISNKKSNTCIRNYSSSESDEEECYTMKTISSINCLYCDKKNHTIEQCREFIAFDPIKRRQLLERYCVCFNCLKQGHITGSCKSKNTCPKCSKKHHILLHGSRNAHSTQIKLKQSNEKPKSFSIKKNESNKTKQTRTHITLENENETQSSENEFNSENELNEQAKTFHIKQSSRRCIGFRTVPVIVENPINRKRLRINALLDDAAGTTLLCNSIAKELKLKKAPLANRLSVSGVGGIVAGISEYESKFRIISDEELTET